VWSPWQRGASVVHRFSFRVSIALGNMTRNLANIAVVRIGAVSRLALETRCARITQQQEWGAEGRLGKYSTSERNTNNVILVE